MVASSAGSIARGDSPTAAAGLEAKSSAGGKRADLKALLPSSFVERTLFQVAYTIIRDGAITSKLAWAIAFIEDIQLFSFIFLRSLQAPMPVSLESALTLFIVPTTYASFVIIDTVAIILVFFTTSLIAIVMLLIHRNKVPGMLLKGLRFMGLLTTTVLSLPILNVLVMGLNCASGSGIMTRTECLAPTHVPFLALNTVCLALYIPLLLFTSLVLVDSSPAYANPLACSNGHANFQSAMLRVILVVLKVFMASESGTAVWVYMTASAAGFAYQSWFYIIEQPYYDRFMNMFRTGMLFGAFIAMCTIMAANALGTDGQQLDILWIILAVVSFTAVLIGANLSKWYLSRLIRRTVSRNRTIRASEAERPDYLDPSEPSSPRPCRTASPMQFSGGIAATSGRRAISDPLEPITGSEPDLSGGSPTSTNTVCVTIPPAAVKNALAFSNAQGFPTAKSSSTLAQALASRVSGALVKGDRLAAVSKGRRRSVGGNKLTSKGLLEPDVATSSTDTLIAMTREKPKVLEFVFNTPQEIEINLRFVRHNPSERQLAVAMELIERGLVEFPNSAQFLMSAAVYLNEFFGVDGERAAEVLFQTLRNKQRHLPVDIRFNLYTRDHQGKEHGKDVLDSAALDQLMRKARHLHLLSLMALRDIWESFRVDVSDAKVADAIAKLSVYERGAEECYQRLLERNSKDVTVLRLFSMFLNCVKGEQGRAAQILELAEELEIGHAVAPFASGAAPMGNQAQRETVTSSRSPASINHTVNTPFIMPANLSGTHGGDSSHHENQAEELESFHTPPMLIQGSHYHPTTPPSFTVSSTHADVERTTGFSVPEHKRHEFDAIEAGRSASQTSGTSASRTLRKRLLKRRMMVERVERPLNQTLFMIVPIVLVTLSVAIGFYVSLGLYNASAEFFNVEFNAARDARGTSRRIIESIRLMISSNLLGDRTEWEAAHSTVSHALDSLMTNSVPSLSKHYQALPVPPESVRLTLQRNMNGTMSDFDTALVSPLNAVERVAQAATIALGYGYQELTPEVFESIPQLNMITGHMRQVFDLIGSLMAAFTNAYRVNLNQNTTMLIVFAIASIAFLVLAMGVTHKFVLSAYFSNESGLYSLLRRIQKRPLSNIVTSLEEEIENFREIGLGDADEDVAELRGMTAGDGRTKSRMDRKVKFSMWMCMYSSVLAVLMLLMYSITITSLNQSADLDRLVLSLDRRLYTTMLRVFTREWTSYDRTVSAVNAIRNLRIVLADLNLAHDKLLNDPTGLSTTLPDLTSLPRKCPTVSSCLTFPPKPSIGYTLESGMVPLNVAITRMSETASEVIAAFVTTPVVDGDTSAFTNSSSYGKYELLISQCTDIIPRVELLDQGIQAMMNRRVVLSSSVTISIFVAFLAVEAVGLLVAWVFGLERLRRESRTLTSLPFLLPAAVLSATKELDAFVESGGLALREGETGE